MSPPTASIRLLAVPPLSLGAAHWQKPQTICLKLSLWRESYSEPLCPKQESEGKHMGGGGVTQSCMPIAQDAEAGGSLQIQGLAGLPNPLASTSTISTPHQPIPPSPRLSHAASPRVTLSSWARISLAASPATPRHQQSKKTRCRRSTRSHCFFKLLCGFLQLQIPSTHQAPANPS